MNDAPLPRRPVDLRETLLTFPSPAPSVLLRKTANFESEGREFESLRARHLTSARQSISGPASNGPRLKFPFSLGFSLGKFFR
jgi:hypothetical protein